MQLEATGCCTFYGGPFTLTNPRYCGEAHVLISDITRYTISIKIAAKVERGKEQIDRVSRGKIPHLEVSRAGDNRRR
jgi:hypothetical protein